MMIKSLLTCMFVILFGVNTVASIGDNSTKYQATTDMIQDVYYNTSDGTYIAETAGRWEIPLSRAKSEDQTRTVSYNQALDGKLVKINYDDNGGSSNMEDWTLENWSLEGK